MSATQADVVIVSAFGRGHWLASELAECGLKVALVDVSHTLGRWTPEDWEGPFGLFQSNQLTPSQVERVTGDDYTDSVDQGFCVWLKEGPVDLKGPLTSYLLEKQNLDPRCEEYLSRCDSAAPGDLRPQREALARLPFASSWLGHLAHQLAANTFALNGDGLSYGDALPLFSPQLIRRVSRRGFEKSLQWCESKGVVVYRNSKVIDFSIEGKEVKGIEIEGPWSGVLEVGKAVWTLSAEQGARQGEAASKALYPRTLPKPSWVWIRYTMSLNATVEVMPQKFLMIDDLCLPWTHSNFCSVQKTVSGRELDIWVRVPYIQRFHKKYLDSVAEDIVSILERRVPGASPEVSSMPQNYLYDEVELGSSLFPVFNKETLSAMQRGTFKNIYFAGPEDSPNLDWTGLMSVQRQIFSNINEWREKRLRKAAKELTRAQQQGARL